MLHLKSKFRCKVNFLCSLFVSLIMVTNIFEFNVVKSSEAETIDTIVNESKEKAAVEKLKSRLNDPLFKNGIKLGLPLIGGLLAFKAIINNCVFPGIHKWGYDLDNIKSKTIELPGTRDVDKALATKNSSYTTNREFISLGDLNGCSYEFISPDSDELRGKCIVVYGPNYVSVQKLITSLPMITFLNKGAKVVTVDYRGYGYSNLKGSWLRISENTLYSDSKAIYQYVRNNLEYQPKDIIIFGYSIGGSVASHVVAYADKLQENLKGLILASPINSLNLAASELTFKPLGALTSIITMSSFDTEKNLSDISNKELPIFICSGDKQDFLSLGKTLLDKKFKDMGFKYVIKNISTDCNHDHLSNMFKSKDFSDFINKFIIDKK